MGEDRQEFRFNHEDTVPTYTIGAAFALAIILGLIVVSGILQKPYDAREVVEAIHERVMMAKEYRELSRISYTGEKSATSTLIRSSNVTDPSPLKSNTHKTERAKHFDKQVKSEPYWKRLQASISGALKSKTAPVVLPPVVVGSR